MRYTSTRDKNVNVSSSWAIAQGISADGGLFVPVEIPKVSLDDIAAMANMSYVERAKRVLSLYLTDFTAEELAYCVEGAYGDNKFSSEDIAPIHELKAGEEILELWRGPTCAFKDMALQMLPRLMTVSVKKAVGTRETVILVATSGDTGKAALEGFKDVEGTKILVFYPDEGVSPMQKLQMTTQEGSNVAVCAIKGNFDDAQTGVKTIFTDKEIGKKLAEHGMAFSSANSINWGRLVPQIVYYFSAYCDMIRNGRIKAGDKINFVVPTGNFGNILAAYYAREMGLPVGRLICEDDCITLNRQVILIVFHVDHSFGRIYHAPDHNRSYLYRVPHKIIYLLFFIVQCHHPHGNLLSGSHRYGPDRTFHLSRYNRQCFYCRIDRRAERIRPEESFLFDRSIIISK